MVIKETYEWIHAWFDENLSNDLPRVLLVGDSITHGYQEKVRELMRGTAYVDYVSLSNAIDQPFYKQVVSSVIESGNYALVHFNHGLHGIHMEKDVYRAEMEAFLSKLKMPVILVTSTSVRPSAGNAQKLQMRVAERNDVVREIAAAQGWSVDDLYEVSIHMAEEKCLEDGVHYTQEGYAEFAKQVADCLTCKISKMLL